MKIAVVGCGTMGARIAGELAYHGHRVRITDNDVKNLNKVYERLQEDKKMLHEEKLMPHKNFIKEELSPLNAESPGVAELLRMTPFETASLIAQLTSIASNQISTFLSRVLAVIEQRLIQGQVLCMSRLEETVSDADVIFEVVIENMEIKQDLFERISHLCKPTAIIATNTLCLSVDSIVERTVNKERTIGLRFLFPVYYIPEVEITAGRHTSPETIERVRILLERMGKTLFFRSGGFPLILSEEEREKRKQARIDQIQDVKSNEKTIPALSHRGNNTPRVDEEGGIVPTDGLDRDCAICMDRLRNCLLQPCHHMVTCYECSKMLHNRKDGCPICRKDITNIIKVYHS